MHSDLSFPLRSFFLAIPLEGRAKLEFQMLQQQLREFGDSLRFQNPDTPHLTLMFWREVMEIDYGQITKQVEKIAKRQKKFELMVDGVGTFGERGPVRPGRHPDSDLKGPGGRDSVLFLTVAFSPELALLKKSCPWTEGRPFLPHITLARVSHTERFSKAKKRVLTALGRASFPMTVDRIALYANVRGVSQTRLQEYYFGDQRSVTSGK